MSETMPRQLVNHLATEVKQQGFPWRRRPWQDALGDDEPTLELLSRLGERVDRESTRAVVLVELSVGRVRPAFVAAMLWGYGATGYGPARVRWVLTGVRGRASAAAPMQPGVPEKLLTGADMARRAGPVEGFRHLNNAGKVPYLGGPFFTKWLYFATAVDGIADLRAAPILDAQVAGWLRAQQVMSLRVDRTLDYERYVTLLSDWGERCGRRVTSRGVV